MDEGSDGDLYLASNFLLFNFDEELSNELRVSTSASFDYSNTKSTIEDTVTRHASQYTFGERYYLQPNWAFSYYLIPDSWFVSTNLNGSARYNHTKQEITDTFLLPASLTNSSKTEDYQFGARVGVGYGKVRDGAVVFRVLRFLEKLEEDNALKRQLERNEIVRLVDLFARRVEYTTNYERFEKYFFRDIFAELESLDVLNDSVASVYSIVRSQEVWRESLLPRIFGWRVQAAVERYYSHFEQNELFGLVLETKNDYFVPSAEYGYDISLNLHLYANVNIRTPLAGPNTRSDVNGSLALSYELGENVESTLQWLYNAWHGASGLPDRARSKRIYRVLRAQLRYYLEDKLLLNATVGYENNRDSSSNIYEDNIFTTSGIFLNFGLSFRIF